MMNKKELAVDSANLPMLPLSNELKMKQARFVTISFVAYDLVSYDFDGPAIYWDDTKIKA